MPVPDKTYPRVIPFESSLDDNRSMLPAKREQLKSALSKTTFTLEAENILRINYPPEEVRQVRIVNIDYSVFRVDFILADDPHALRRVNLFPRAGWHQNNLFANGSFDRMQREDGPGFARLIFPEI